MIRKIILGEVLNHGRDKGISEEECSPYILGKKHKQKNDDSVTKREKNGRQKLKTITRMALE